MRNAKSLVFIGLLLLATFLIVRRINVYLDKAYDNLGKHIRCNKCRKCADREIPLIDVSGTATKNASIIITTAFLYLFAGPHPSVMPMTRAGVRCHLPVADVEVVNHEISLPCQRR